MNFVVGDINRLRVVGLGSLGGFGSLGSLGQVKVNAPAVDVGPVEGLRAERPGVGGRIKLFYSSPTALRNKLECFAIADVKM